MTYDEIRQAMNGEPYTMSLVADDAILVKEAVNQGIDSRLEACFCPDRGDSFDVVDNGIMGKRLNCVVSVESFPVLLRRLIEMDTEEDDTILLVGDILETLGFRDGTEIALYGIESPCDNLTSPE
jgi:hypothetical protein